MMKTIKFMAEIQWPAPDDFDERKIVEFRPPKSGESYLTQGGNIAKSLTNWSVDDKLLRPIIDD